MQVAILAAVDGGDLATFGQRRKRGFPEESGGDQQVVKYLFRHLPLSGSSLHPPAKSWTIFGRSGERLGLLDMGPKVELRPGAVRLEVARQVLPNLISAWKLRRVFWPGEITELDSVLALVCDHAGMDKTGSVILVGWPKAANSRLAIKDGHIKGAGGYIVEERLGSHEAGRSGTWYWLGAVAMAEGGCSHSPTIQTLFGIAMDMSLLRVTTKLGPW